MLDLSAYSHTIGNQQPNDWFRPVLDRGRAAAFVDTSFIRALIDDDDQFHNSAINHFGRATANYYTTNLVLAEAARQVAKTSRISMYKRNQWHEKCTDLLIQRETVFVCVPQRDVLIQAYWELDEMRKIVPDLDLCDVLSFSVLNYARHSRVFGFDHHFQVFGAKIEP